jgi:hypothetical protein
MINSKINLITPPDNLFNYNPSYLLVKPSSKIKMQFQQFLAKCEDEVNVFIYDEEDFDIAWLLSVSRNTDIIIIDIDNSDELTKHFIGTLLIHPRSFYLTNDDKSPWGLLSRNRIFNVEGIVDYLLCEEEDYDDDEEDEEE